MRAFGPFPTFATAVAVIATLCSLPSAGVEPNRVEPDESQPAAYRRLVMEDRPTLYFDCNGEAFRSLGSLKVSAEARGKVGMKLAAAQAPQYPLMSADNRAVQFAGQGGYLAVDDPGPDSPLDFGRDDAITLEAWVRLADITAGQQVYIVGKGRTQRPGFAADNQNFALRLRGVDGTARISFLYRTASPGATFHRWNSTEGFLPGSGWHHVAVTYEFGSRDSIRGYVDGQPVGGDWDMGKPTDSPVVQDDDQVWIGSSMGGQAGSSFRGRIDEVALYRRVLSPERLAARFQKAPAAPRDLAAELAGLPGDTVAISIFSGLSETPWEFEERPAPLAELREPGFALTQLPQHYVGDGVRGESPNPLLVRMAGRRSFEEGSHELLLRCKSASRLWIDGRQVGQTPFMKRNSSGHEEVPELPQFDARKLAPLSMGHQEQRVAVDLPPGPHLIEWEMVVGGKGLRAEIGEAVLGIRPAGSDGPFQLLTPDGAAPHDLSDHAWTEWRRAARQRMLASDQRRRRELAALHDAYWEVRHEHARDVAARGRSERAIPENPAGFPAHNAVDHFVNSRLAASQTPPQSLRSAELDGDAFLRRLSLDTVGVIPSREELLEFRAASAAARRADAIDKRLDDPRWADHWVAYWQDVLAENPGILKPKLNNTGPFRFWIYEAFLDHKPLDRMVTELVAMEGGPYAGGPAAFAVATQNDVPMAAKAHIVSKAFLGIEMKCARCHDAPYHPHKQQQLFGLAALLQEQAIKVPSSSSVPQLEGRRRPLINVTLRPGVDVAPTWPFAALSPPEEIEPLLRPGDGPRERLAALVTSPHNLRFAEVAVNRLWRRYMGTGLVEPVDDWHEAAPTHPELLEFLAWELIAHDYDLRHVARLIFNSHAYQRQTAGDGTEDNAEGESAARFVGPTRRRLTAEQVLDSLFAASGKDLGVEELTFDPEGRRGISTFLNLGEPRRAWEFTSLSNERDRPALALPAAQTMIDLLLAFGWRDSRPNPVTDRELSPTVLQPLALANGLAAARITRLSDDHAITALCLEQQPLERLIDAVFETLLTRRPTGPEQELFVELLRDGYDTRIVPGAAVELPRRARHAVSWSNHLHREATRIKLELERQVRAGDPPTQRLQANWRRRMEDMVWALINTPEFIFQP